MRPTGESWGTWPLGGFTTPPGAILFFFPPGLNLADLDGPLAWAWVLLRPTKFRPPACRA